jgi:DNA repair exonuclease SbcCD ATPase subunit
MSANAKQAAVSTDLDTSETSDTKNSIAPAVAATDIAEYRPHEEQIVRLETSYAKLVVDCSTSEGLANAKEVRVDIRDVRYALANTTKTALVPYQQKVKEAQARVNQVKEFGEALKDRVLVIEAPVDEAIKAEEKRIADAKAERERIEAERVEAIRAKINRFSSVAAAYASRSAADVASVLQSVKESVILPEEYAEFEAEGTIARDNAIEQLETLHRAAVEREEAAAKLAAQQKELNELREKQRIADENAEKERQRIAAEDRQRIADQQAELNRQREQLQRDQDAQRLKDEQNQRDQEELARLRAQAAAPATTIAAVTPLIEEKVEVAPINTPAIAAEFDDVTTTAPAVEDIVEVVALGFDVSVDTARAWLRAIRF